MVKNMFNIQYVFVHNTKKQKQKQLNHILQVAALLIVIDRYAKKKKKKNWKRRYTVTLFEHLYGTSVHRNLSDRLCYYHLKKWF